MSLHSCLSKIVVFFWRYWNWPWGKEKNVIEINLPTDIEGEGSEKNKVYFARLLKKKLGKIKKGRIYKLDKSSDEEDVYVVINWSLIKFDKPDEAVIDQEQNDGDYVYRSLNKVLGEGKHGRVKSSEIGIRFNSKTGEPIIGELIIDDTVMVIKKQRTGFFGKSKPDIEKEASWNKRLFSEPGSMKDFPVISKTHYGISTYFAYTLTPILKGISLDKYISLNKDVTLDKKFIILKGTLGKLEELKGERVAHCDLKPGNIMFNDEDGSVNLFDFCTVTEFKKYPPYYPALPGFRSHTPSWCEEVSDKFDVYSFGVMAKALLPRDIRSMKVGDGDKTLGKILHKMHSSDSTKRPSIEELIKVFDMAHSQLRTYFSDKVQGYITSREGGAQYKHSFFECFQYDKKIKLQSADILLKALEASKTEGTAVLNLTAKQYAAIQQGSLGIIFNEAMTSGFLTVGDCHRASRSKQVSHV